VGKGEQGGKERRGNRNARRRNYGAKLQPIVWENWGPSLSPHTQGKSTLGCPERKLGVFMGRKGVTSRKGRRVQISVEEEKKGRGLNMS